MVQGVHEKKSLQAAAQVARGGTQQSSARANGWGHLQKDVRERQGLWVSVSSRLNAAGAWSSHFAWVLQVKGSGGISCLLEKEGLLAFVELRTGWELGSPSISAFGALGSSQLSLCC